jgi:hypothetical protein
MEVLPKRLGMFYYTSSLFRYPMIWHSCRWWSVRHGPIQKGMCVEFEQHVRCLMATGTTARQTRETLFLNATHFVGGPTAHLSLLTVTNTNPLLVPHLRRSGRLLASDRGPIFLKLKEEAASFTKRSTYI